MYINPPQIKEKSDTDQVMPELTNDLLPQMVGEGTQPHTREDLLEKCV